MRLQYIEKKRIEEHRALFFITALQVRVGRQQTLQKQSFETVNICIHRFMH